MSAAVKAIPDCPTKRWERSELAVKRMFAEAELAESVQAIENAHQSVRERWRSFVAQLAIWTL